MADGPVRRHTPPELNTSDPLAVHVFYLREDVDRCVTREEFDPVKRLVYGTVTLILSAFIAGLIGMVMYIGSAAGHK